MLSRFLATLLLACCLPISVQAAPFDQLLQSALEHNRSLSSAYQEWQARKSMAAASGFLPDPMIAVDHFTTPIETRTGPQEQRLMLEQKLPWFGTRQLQSDEKQQEAQSAYWQWEVRKLELQNQLAQLYGELFYWRQSYALAEYSIKLWQELEAIATARYRVAASRQPDLVRIQVGHQKALDRLLSLQQQQPALQARLALLTGDAAGSAAESWPDILAAGDASGSRTDWQSLLEHHPALQQMDAMLAAADTGVKLADKRYAPDVTLRYGRLFTDDALNPAMQDSGKDPEYLGIGLNIPLWTTQYDARRQAAVTRTLSLQEQRAYLQEQLSSQLAQFQFQLRDNTRQLQLYRNELIPRTDEALQTQLRAYQTGDAAFLDVIDTEQQLIELQTMAIRFEQQRWNALHGVLLVTGLSYLDWIKGTQP
ncbi:MAG: TolC family protein [Gammaproteobacteria bacterium]